MKLLSYALEPRMEPRLAFSLNGYAVDVMRAALWMKVERNSHDYLNLASSMRLALENWSLTTSLLHELLNAFQSLELSKLKVYDRLVAMAETEIAFFPPIPDPPTLRLFQSFQQDAGRAFFFGNTQTLLGHLQPLRFSGLAPSIEMAAIVGNSGEAQRPTIAGYCIANNWINPAAPAADSGLRWGLATSLGPYLITAEELENHKTGLGFNLEARISRNSVKEAAGRFTEMQLSFHDMLRVADRTRVQAGDVFLSGSPFSRVESTTESDEVALEIQALGLLSTPPVQKSD